MSGILFEIGRFALLHKSSCSGGGGGGGGSGGDGDAVKTVFVVAARTFSRLRSWLGFEPGLLTVVR
jgi:hypothetical protein